MMPSFNKTCMVLFVLLAGGSAIAGGPLAVEGARGHTPVSYSPASVALNFDIGTLGSRTNSEADALVLQGFALWNNVSTATIQISQGSDLSEDIDVSNYMDLIPDGSQNHPGLSDNLNPLIYDDDGQIIDEIFMPVRVTILPVLPLLFILSVKIILKKVMQYSMASCAE